jgi:hypothetical protein
MGSKAPGEAHCVFSEPVARPTISPRALRLRRRLKIDRYRGADFCIIIETGIRRAGVYDIQRAYDTKSVIRDRMEMKN